MKKNATMFHMNWSRTELNTDTCKAGFREKVYSSTMCSDYSLTSTHCYEIQYRNMLDLYQMAFNDWNIKKRITNLSVI